MSHSYIPTAVAVAALLFGVAGCDQLGGSDVSQTTCKEFAELGPNTGLDEAFTDEQEDVLSDLLSENNRVAGQEMQAGLQVIAYCNIYGGHAGSHENDPIGNIPGLQD
ncbi:hypothetical protein [Nocardioides pelophilus]|uniref:hypothetical protein n=1 Tax=Nocardioides pelophilus TaxID=2172019 RepID=UPI0016021B87|nr:hypothetical protein [Nocardioides pelophilus]